jgi:hypothetical protein
MDGMNLAAKTAPKYSLSWRLKSRSAVFLTMMAAIIAGHILSGDAFASFYSTLEVWISWTLLQLVCLLLGMGWSKGAKSRLVRRLTIFARRKWRSVRTHLRRRWAEERRRKFTHWEEDVLFMAFVLVGIAAIVLIPPLPFILFFGAISIVILLINAPLYRDAPINLEMMLAKAIPIGFLMGYAV